MLPRQACTHWRALCCACGGRKCCARRASFACAIVTIGALRQPTKSCGAFRPQLARCGTASCKTAARARSTHRARMVRKSAWFTLGTRRAACRSSSSRCTCAACASTENSRMPRIAPCWFRRSITRESSRARAARTIGARRRRRRLILRHTIALLRTVAHAIARARRRSKRKLPRGARSKMR